MHEQCNMDLNNGLTVIFYVVGASIRTDPIIDYCTCHAPGAALTPYLLQAIS